MTYLLYASLRIRYAYKSINTDVIFYNFVDFKPNHNRKINFTYLVVLNMHQLFYRTFLMIVFVLLF